MKKIKTLLSLIFIFSFSICLIGCNKKAKIEETIMNISCNPSVEFILDKNNKVLSVTALNEDGNIIIIDENFIGLQAEEAAELFVKVAKETGFIINESLNENQNNIEVSISGDTTKAKNLYTKVKSKMKDFLDSNDIISTIKQGKELTTKYIKQLVKENYNYLTDEQINNFSQSELINHLKEAREETKDFYSQGLKDAYIALKEQEATNIKNEEILEIVIQFMGDYEIEVNAYLDAINLVESTISILKNTRYNYLINNESIYKTILQELTNAKNELITKKNEIAKMEEGTLKETAKASLTLLETALSVAESAYNTQYTTIESTLNNAINSLNQAQKALDELVENLPSEIKTAINEKAQELEETYNTAKESILNNFLSTYEEQIANTTNDVLSRKELLKFTILDIENN